MSVFLVDNQELVRDALAQRLSAAGLDVVGGARAGEACLRWVAELRPDVVLIEPFEDGVGGIEVVGQLAAAVPDSRILVLTGNQGHPPVVEAIVAGASGYMLKEAPPEETVGAIRASAAGEGVICLRIAGELLERIRQRYLPEHAANGAASAIQTSLTARELEIFRRLASGKTNMEIGREMSLSDHTVKNHVASILDKLRLDNRVQAAVEAVRSGIA